MTTAEDAMTSPVPSWQPRALAAAEGATVGACSLTGGLKPVVKMGYEPEVMRVL